MKAVRIWSVCGLALCAWSVACAEPVWSGEAWKGWLKGLHQVEKAEVLETGLRIVCGGADTHIYSSDFKIKASPVQEVVFRARGTGSGMGELFWMPPGKSPIQKWSCQFQWIGDGEWHEYRLHPYWQGEKMIGRLRLDFPSMGQFDISRCAIEEVRPALDVVAADYAGVSFSATVNHDAEWQIQWAGDGESGLKKERVRLPGDGRRHTYYLPLGVKPAWKGRISLMQAVAADGKVVPVDFRFEKEEPELPADIVVKRARCTDAFNRVGYPVPLTVLVGNLGLETAENVRLVAVKLPEGVTLRNSETLVGAVYGGTAKTFHAALECARAGRFTAEFELRVPNAAPIPVSIPVEVLPSLGLAKASYVPEPKPVATDYDIAALYFPGWERVQAWERVWKVCPERKPVLGWYDEANPEVVDWQIKWLVENGIRTLYVDWYWHKGSQHHDHWVKAFYKAKYRHFLKWAMMWANHNPSGSHSEADQRAVTQFWIDNYFKTPEYLRIDGKPVVWIWAAGNMNRDCGKDGCKRLLEISREMAVAAGLKGIYFIAMKWPEADCRAVTIQKYKDMGFDMTGIYHFMSPGKAHPAGRRYPYSAVAAANPANWRDQFAAGVMPFLPNLATGWDDRPWNDHCEVYGKNVQDFRRICEEAKKFADETGIKRLCLAPLNEWGEGSYAEPNAEHGFGFYEAVRDTFCHKPATGWPLNYGPKDVGLGPYDLPPPPAARPITAWTFTSDQTLGWHAMMNVSGFKATPEGLVFRTTNHDPAISCNFLPVAAKKYTMVEVTMKVTGGRPNMYAQLFWATTDADVSERTSVSQPVIADGARHTYRFPVASVKTWRGRVDRFRFDPVNATGAEITVESITLK